LKEGNRLNSIYNNIKYIKDNFKEGNYIYFEYKKSLGTVYYELPNKKCKYQIYFECDTMYYEMDTQYFNTIEEFFELGLVEGELIKDIWSKVIRTAGF